MRFDTEARTITRQIEDALNAAGLFFRIFYRGKSEESLLGKIKKSPGKYGSGKKIQDLIGIRVCVYFGDDIALVKYLISQKFEYDHVSSTIDLPEKTEFGPTRFNLIFKLPEEVSLSMYIPKELQDSLDHTFEVQIRTILSEGWHEVEHDLRYKFPSDWDGVDWASRAFNGVFAALETSEWTMLKIIDDQAHTHYKNMQWASMLRSKFRLRFSDQSLDNELKNWLDSDLNAAKKLFRSDREALIAYILSLGPLPITISNLLYIYNFATIKNSDVLKCTPRFLIRLLESRTNPEKLNFLMEA